METKAPEMPELTNARGEQDIAPPPGCAHRYVHANGLRFHCVEGGAGPLVLLLHGFPEFWYSWRAELP